MTDDDGDGGELPAKKTGWPFWAWLLIGCGGLTVLTVPAVGIVAAVAIPNLIQARKHANETAAIGALKTIVTAQAIFREADKDGDGKPNYADLDALASTSMVDSVLGSGQKQGYRFQVKPLTDPTKGFWAMATPTVPGTTGDRTFYVNHEGAVSYVPRTQGAAPLPDPVTGARPQDAVSLGR